MTTTAKVAVVYHSGFGHTKVLGEAVVRGAASVPGVTATLVPVGDLPAPGPDRSLGGRWGEVNGADAIVFGAPTYMGSVSAEFKKFMEHSSGVWFTQGWKDKLAGGFVNSGGPSGDKLSALLSLVVFAGQHSMTWVSQGVMPSSVTGDGQDLNRLGSWIGAMAQSGNESPEVTPPEGDRKTAERYGRRIGESALRWVRGRG